MKPKPPFSWFAIGTFSGYLIIHPIFMIIGYLMHTESMQVEHSLYDVVTQSYSIDMLPWSLPISMACGLMVYLYRKIVLSEALLKKAGEELELKVKEKTVKLSETNYALRNEIKDRKNINEELTERVRQAALAADIGNTMVRSQDLRQSLQLCTEHIVEHLDAAFARIWVLKKDSNILELKASAGMYTHIDGNHSSIPLGKYKIGKLAQANKPLLTNQVIGDPQISDQEWAKREGMVAFAGHPLVLAGKMTGVMAMFSKKPLKKSTLQALGSISDEIAIGIEQLKAKSHIHFLAYYDSLTNLPNKYLFKEFLEKSIKLSRRHNNPFCVAIINIDNFSDINDTYGHSVGDKLLKIFSYRLINTLRDSDIVTRISNDEDPIARMGGDEFLVLLQEIGEVNALNSVINRLQKELSNSYQLNDLEIFITVSIGIAKYPDNGKTVDDIIKNADTALNNIKRNGKNHYQFYSKSMNDQALENMTLATNLRKALNREDLLLYYQPKIDSMTKQLIGAEALIRWKSDQGEFISPSRFIPIAESNGLILPIGDFVLRTACLQNKLWQNRNLRNICIAVNVSGFQFGQDDFVSHVLSILEEADLSPQYLELEVTETAIMKNPDKAITNLNKLKNTGIRVSIDDFGTGYSSLNYLRKLPLDSLKVDMSFIKNVLTNRSDEIIVKTIITMAHSLNLKVIAEGVESEEQFEFLKAHDCDVIQGYFFSPAVPSVDFEKMLSL